MNPIDLHAIARNSDLIRAEMYAIASIAAAHATKRSGYATIITANPSIPEVRVHDNVHSARVYLDCAHAPGTPRRSEVHYITVDIVIDVAGATPQLNGLLVRGMDVRREQINDVSVDFVPHDSVEGYVAIGEIISEVIAAVL